MLDPKQQQAKPAVIKSAAGWECANCRKWAREHKQLCVISAGQIIPLEKMREALLKEGKGQTVNPELIREIALCTHGPTWVPHSNDHWCWNFLPLKGDA